MKHLLRVAAILALAMPLLVGCGHAAQEQAQPLARTPSVDETNLTVEELYAYFAEAISRPQSVYKVTISSNYEGGPFGDSALTSTNWVDAAQNRQREESKATIGPDGDKSEMKTESVMVNGGLYRHQKEPAGEYADSKVEALSCYGANAAVSTVLGCPGWTEKSTKALEFGRYKGQNVIALVTSGTRSGEDETTTFVERLYLSADTLLPIVLQGEGDTDYGEIFHGTWVDTYDNDFVPADSLPDDFFDQASIGYVEPDPEARLNGKFPFTVYWLGRIFEAAPGLPALTLANEDSRVNDPLAVTYRSVDKPFGAVLLSLDEYSVDAWMKSQQFPPARGATPGPVENWWEQPCKDTVLASARATLVLDLSADTPPLTNGERACIFSSPAGINLPDRFFALVFLDATVLEIDASESLDEQAQWSQSPYNSAEAMEAVARALQPR